MDLPKDLPPDVVADIFAEFQEDFGDFQPQMASVAAQPEIHVHNLDEDTSTLLFGDLGIYGDEIESFTSSNKGSACLQIEMGVSLSLMSEKLNPCCSGSENTTSPIMFAIGVYLRHQKNYRYILIYGGESYCCNGTICMFQQVSISVVSILVAYG